MRTLALACGVLGFVLATLAMGCGARQDARHATMAPRTRDDGAWRDQAACEALESQPAVDDCYRALGY